MHVETWFHRHFFPSVSKSSWKTANNFPLTLRYFLKYVKSSTEEPVVLFLDNYNSPVNIAQKVKGKNAMFFW